jgi:O-antigen/teichoic acid export membrane protein
MKKIVRSEFAANVLRLMTGTTLSQLITFMLMPILSRLYSPEDFGIYAFYTSMITLLVVFSTGRYELAIPLPKEKSDAWQILLLSFLILTGFSALVFFLVMFFNQPIVDFLGRPNLKNWLYLLPVFVFLTGAYNIFTLWFHRLSLWSCVFSRSSRIELQQKSDTTTYIKHHDQAFLDSPSFVYCSVFSITLVFPYVFG